MLAYALSSSIWILLSAPIKRLKKNERFLKDFSCLPDSMRIDDCFLKVKALKRKLVVKFVHYKVVIMV